MKQESRYNIVKDINIYCDKISEPEINPFLIRNPELRELYEKNLVVYADGYFVIADEKYVYSDAQGYHLTEIAYTNFQECIIGRKKEMTSYKQDKDRIICHGIPVNNLVQNTYRISRSGLTVIKRLYENLYQITSADDIGKAKQLNDEFFDPKAENELKKIINDPEKTFCNCLSFLMEYRKWKSVDFHKNTGLNQDYFSKINRNDYTKMDLRNLLIICISLRINRELIELILGKAGYKLRIEDKNERIYLDILSDFQYLTIDEFDIMAEIKGAQPLKKEEKEDRVRSKTNIKNGI